MELAKSIIPEKIWEHYPFLNNTLSGNREFYKCMQKCDVPEMVKKLEDGLVNNGVVYQTQYEMMKACTIAEKGKYNSWHEVRGVKGIVSGVRINPIQVQYLIVKFSDFIKSVKLPGNPTSANVKVNGRVIHDLDLSDVDENGFIPIYQNLLSLHSAPYGMSFLNVTYDEPPSEVVAQFEGITIEPVLTSILRAGTCY